MSSFVDKLTPMKRPAKLWGHKITKAWQASVEAIVEVGSLLIQAKAELPHGEFEEMVRQSCPFRASAARKLMRIAAHPIIANRSSGTVLPSAWTILADLSSFEPAELSHAISNHWVKPEMTREDVKYLHARVQKALGFRKRMPPQSSAVSRPKSFQSYLRSSLDAAALEWLGSVDEQTAQTIAERVAGLIKQLRLEMTDGQQPESETLQCHGPSRADEEREAVDVEVLGQNVTMYAVVMTPEIATEIVEKCNLRNRSVRQNKVIEWIAAMREGEWMLRDGITFTDAGELIDGQHRVIAVSEAGVPVPFLLRVIPNAKAKDDNRVTDIGVPRNIPDFLHFNSVPDAPRAAPILVLERNARISGSPLQKAKGTKADYLALHREIGDEPFKRVFDMLPRGLHTALGVQRGFLDWFAMHAMKVDAGGAALFFGLLHDPSQLKATDAPYVLRESLIDLQRRSQQVTLVQQAHMTAKAWAYFGEGQPTTPAKIKHRINEDWPGVYGEEGERDA